MKKIILFAALVAFSLSGCEVPETSQQREMRMRQFGKENFPNGAKKAMDFGNGWYTFELEIDGKNHKFLYRMTKPQSSSKTETVTEISQ
jgi:hypothetical protein